MHRPKRSRNRERKRMKKQREKKEWEKLGSGIVLFGKAQPYTKDKLLQFPMTRLPL